MKRLTREWVAKAESDLAVARMLVRENGRHYDEVCFHCQQSAEKYLKALLQESGAVVPRTHLFVHLYVAAISLFPTAFSGYAARDEVPDPVRRRCALPRTSRPSATGAVCPARGVWAASQWSRVPRSRTTVPGPASMARRRIASGPTYRYRLVMSPCPDRLQFSSTESSKPCEVE